MIINNTPQIHQTVMPEVRTQGTAPARAEFKAAAATPAQNAPRQASAEELKSAVAVINQSLRQSNHNLEFSVDTDTHQTVVKMVDTSTGELIRQFPSETALAISRSIGQSQQGLLLTQKA